MAADLIEKLRAGVRDVPDFPKPGIVFKDITPILSDGALFKASIDVFLERCRGKKIDKIVGIDARGFLFGSAVAYELGVGFVPIRKRGKLPYKTETAKYSLEYGEAEMEMHVDAISPGEQIVLVDDLLATGGTSAAAAMLIAKTGGELLEAQFLIELEFLHGRQKLAPTPVVSFLSTERKPDRILWIESCKIPLILSFFPLGIAATTVRPATRPLSDDDFHFNVLKAELIVNHAEKLNRARVRHMRATHFDARMFLRQLGMRLGKLAIEQKRSVGVEAFLQFV